MRPTRRWTTCLFPGDGPPFSPGVVAVPGRTSVHGRGTGIPVPAVRQVRAPLHIANVRVLRLDWDAGVAPLTLSEIVARLRRAGYRPLALGQCRSPGGKGTHAWLVIHPACRMPAQVVALQAILGSDPYREASNLFRAGKLARVPKALRTWWNVLYGRSPVGREIIV